MSAEQKSYPSQLEKVKAITDQLEAGIQSLFESEKFKQYLTSFGMSTSTGPLRPLWAMRKAARMVSARSMHI